MAIAFVQDKQATGPTGSGMTINLNLNPQIGNFLLTTVAMQSGASIASVTSPGAIGATPRWIQVGSSYGSTGGCEIWMCRGTPNTDGQVKVAFTGSAASVVATVTELSGVGIVPLDAWSQNIGGSTAPVGTTITPRQNGDLIVSVMAGVAPISTSPSGYTSLGTLGNVGGSAFLVESGSVSATPLWGLTASVPWVTTTAAFLASESQNPSGTPNPNLQFPEVLVQMCSQNWMAPFSGQAVWTDVTQYVQSMTLGPIGRQHELDRVQAAPSQIVFDNRFGQFNPWNTQSFLYNGCLDPMSPVRVVAAWNGATTPVYYGYFQSIKNNIKNVLDVDAELDCIDIFQVLSLKYLASNTYPTLVKADGGNNLVAYYRCGDALGSFSIADQSGNGFTGSLISGQGGAPAFNSTGAFLYDPNTSLDLTNGTSAPNGGFQMVNNLVQPPTSYNPLASASAWTFECWEQWSQSSPPSASVAAIGTTSSSVAAVPNGILMHASAASVTTGLASEIIEIVAGYSGNGLGLAGTQTYNQVVMLNTGFGGGTVGVVGTNPPSNIFDGNFHHIVVTSGTHAATEIYVDGVSCPSSFITAVGAGSVSSITVGSPAQSSSGIQVVGQLAEAWAGTIDEVAIYNVALTPTQIANHYAVGQWFQSVEVGAATGGTTTNRIAKVLSVCGIPTSILNVPYPFRTLLYAETNPVTTTSGLNYIQTTTETEPGIVFQGPNGYINAYNREYQYLNPTSVTSQGIFGDNTSTAAYYYDGPSFVLAQDDLDLFNDIQAQSGRGGFQLSANQQSAGSAQDSTAAPFTVGGGQLEEWGPNQSTAMATSASVYGARTLQGLTSLQQEYDSDALAMAQNYAQWYGFPIPRVQGITLNCTANGGGNIPQMLGRNIYDRITVQYQGQVAGPQFSQDSLIEQVTHTITIKDGPTWATSFALSPYEILMQPTILGTWTFGSPSSAGVLTL